MKKLLEALHVIQDECNKHPNMCTDECPFYHKDRGCAILENKPNFWVINDPQKALQ